MLASITEFVICISMFNPTMFNLRALQFTVSDYHLDWLNVPFWHDFQPLAHGQHLRSFSANEIPEQKQNATVTICVGHRYIVQYY